MENLQRGQSILDNIPQMTAVSDASMTGWGMTLKGLSVKGVWPKDHNHHINLLELRAIRLGLQQLKEVVHNKVVAIIADNVTALAYIQKQGGTRSRTLTMEARELWTWAERNKTKLVCQFLQGKDNVVADSLSRSNQIISTEWTLHIEVCRQLWRRWNQPLVDLFATSLNYRLQTYVSPAPDDMALARDAMLFDWDGLDVYAFPPFPLIRKVLNKLRVSHQTSMTLVAPFWPQREWWPDLLSVAVDFPVALPNRKDLLKQPHFHRFHKNPSLLGLTGWRLSSDLSKQPVQLRKQLISLNEYTDLPQL